MTRFWIFLVTTGGMLSTRASVLRGLSMMTTSSSRSTATSTSSRGYIGDLLSNPSLIRPATAAPGVPTFEVRDPAAAAATAAIPESSVLANVPVMTGHDAAECIERSQRAIADWRDGTTAARRGQLLSTWSRLIGENADDLAMIMTLESGKPLSESLGEVTYGRSFLDYFAAEGQRPTGAGGGFLVPTTFAAADGSGAPRGQIMAVQQAVGVTALITPWNFPLAMITRKVGPALAAGCTAVVKPSELTPLTALALQRLAEEAGIPHGVLQTVTADADTTPEVGMAFCTHPAVQKVSFTGSTAVGKLLMKLSSDTVKRLSLELGGNAVFVVFDDADVDQAVSAAMASKFRNAGQTCVCADRFLVHESVHDAFVGQLKDRVEGMRVGPGTDSDTAMGPLITAEAVERVHGKVQEALSAGAELVFGGSPQPDLGSHFYRPTILTDVPPDASLWKTETFGPVAAVRRFSSEQEALELANDCPVGLASYFCTRDVSRAFRFAKGLECGIVGVNDGIISTCAAPFGGVKESGLGREGSPLGLAEYLETKYIFMNV